MKRGILFFFNMGNITLAARIAIIPLAWTLTRFLPPAFFVSLTLLIISLIIAIIPAPSDKSMIRAIANFREEVKRQMSYECEIRDPEKFIILHGFRKAGNMKLRRRVRSEMVYPFPTSFLFAERGNKKFLMIAKKSLLKSEPIDYEMICLHEPGEAGAFRMTVQIDPQVEEMVELTLYTKHAPYGITILAENDYHYRDFVNAIQCVVE